MITRPLHLLVLLLCAAQSGCATAGTYLLGPADVPRSKTVQIETVPPGAILTGVGEDLGQLTTPGSIELGYTETPPRDGLWWLGWALGTVIDVAVGVLSFWGAATTGNDDLRDAAAGGATYSVIALLIDAAWLATGTGGPNSREYRMIAELDGHRPQSIQISVPSEEKNLELALEPRVTDPEVAERVFVSDLVLTGFPAELAALVTGVIADQLGGRQAVTRRDLSAVIDAERMRDDLGCSDVACFAELAGMAGAGLTVTGEAGLVGTQVVCTLQLIDARSATVRSRIVEKVPVGESEQDALLAAVEQAARRLFAD